MSKEIKAHVPPFDTVVSNSDAVVSNLDTVDGGQYSVSNTGTITVDTIPLDSEVTLTLTDTPEYKFREDELIAEFKDYIDSTYGGHYGQGGLQSSEVIIDRGHGMGFFLGNVDKYNARYGKKGTPEDQRKDIVKIIHYGFLALFEHDRLHGK